MSRILWQYTRAVGFGMMLLLITMYLLNLPHVSRLLLGVFFVLNLGLLFVEKTVVYAMLQRYRAQGFNIRNLLILGSRGAARDLNDGL